MILLQATDFGDDGVARKQLSAIVTDDGLPPVVLAGATVLGMIDDSPARVYVLCVDPDTDTLNLAVAGPRE